MGGKAPPPPAPTPTPPPEPPKPIAEINPNAAADKVSGATGTSYAEREAAKDEQKNNTSKLGATSNDTQTRRRGGSPQKDPAAAVSNLNGALASPAVLTG